jgi:hypothetical protein
MKPNNILRFFVAACAGIALAACNKPADLKVQNEGTVYMPQAVGDRAKIDLQLSPNPQEIAFGAAYGGLNFSKQENAVSFKVDTTLVATYNNRNGTGYRVLPDSVYTISGLNAVIPAGATSSNPLTLTVSSSKMRFGVRYMLPIVFSNASVGPVDPNLTTAYFRFDTILRKSIDVTSQGVLSVSNENAGGSGAGEGSPKLVDNDINTKFLYPGFNPNGWFQLRFTAAVAVGAYTFTSGDDAPPRDPKTWTLQGSNDGTTWTILDTRVNEAFSARKQTRRFEVPFSNVAAYTYYRIFLTANNGDGLFQMAEWRMIRYE